MKVEGFFSGIKNANKAVEKLRQAGFNNSYADINEHYMVHNNMETNLPGSENTPSLSDLVLKSGDPSEFSDKSPLIAASPMVSGMGRFEEVMDVNYKVVANVSDNDKENVSEIIRSMGGDLNSPNLNLPDRIKDLKIRNIDDGDFNMGTVDDTEEMT
jgi:hypothetical protein